MRYIEHTNDRIIDDGSNIVFLDFDGVIATDRAYHAYRQDVAPRLPMRAIDPISIMLLNRILEHSKYDDTRFVISSTWRDYHDKFSIESILYTNGFKGRLHYNWFTPQGLKTRDEEILAWLKDHPYTKDNWIVIDDLDFYDKEIIKRHVKTDEFDGITTVAYNTMIRKCKHYFRKGDKDES